VIYPKLIAQLQQEISRESGVVVSFDEQKDLQSISNIKHRRRAEQALAMSKVSHGQNHLVLMGVCALGGLASPIPFAIAALLYSTGEIIYSYN